ncbi:MAG: S8 family serine peptidase [Sedimentisphaerales bacterium]
MILAAFAASFVFADSNSSGQKSVVGIVYEAVQEHRILYKLTTPDEFKQIAGQPVKETKRTEGGMEYCDIEYSDVRARFAKMSDYPAPFTILWVAGKGGAFDIGKNHQIVLRNTDDLNKFDSFWGFAGVSLVNLDLRGHKKLLDNMPFDSLTKWPEPNKLPEGFQPADLLEKGKDPGLGIKELHERGIDGKGISIVIIDQPLLTNHIEYENRILRYREVEVQGVDIQMHGSPVCSIAVGETCGVAPKASLYYYAVPVWKWLDNKPWADTINKIIELNKDLRESEKIRVVSISVGTFSQGPNFDLWKQAVDKANQNGILVVTCDPTFLKLGMLKRKENEPADLPASYEIISDRPDAELLVLTSNRTIASYKGPEVYRYERQGGLSWAVPYLAGLAALAYQVNPQIKPDEIVKLWIETAVKTDAGTVVNPLGFIEAVQKGKLK